MPLVAVIHLVRFAGSHLFASADICEDLHLTKSGVLCCISRKRPAIMAIRYQQNYSKLIVRGPKEKAGTLT